MLDQFPEVIIAPQIDGITGLMGLTRMTTQRVYLHAVENNTSHIHDKLNYPNGVFFHDSVHMDNHEHASAKLSRLRGGSYEETALPFHNAFLLRMQNLHSWEREMLELVYHYIVFEEPYHGYGQIFDRVFKYPNTSSLRVFYVDEWKTHLHHNRATLPDWVGPDITDVKAFLIEAMNLYDDTAREVFNSL